MTVLAERLTSDAIGDTILQVAAVSPDEARGLRAIVALAVRHERRTAAQIGRGFEFAGPKQMRLLGRLRGEILLAYVALDLAQHTVRAPTLAAFLASNDVQLAAEETGARPRTVQRWIWHFIQFAALYESKRERRKRVRDLREAQEIRRQREAAENAIEHARRALWLQCKQTCGRETRGGTGPGGEGCGHCPLRNIPPKEKR